MKREETIVSQSTVFNGKIFSVDRMEITLPNGRPALREVVRNPGASAVVAADENGRVAMVRQYRIATQSELWELPAGKLDPGEDPLPARRGSCPRRRGSRPSDGKSSPPCGLLPGSATRYCTSTWPRI